VELFKQYYPHYQEKSRKDNDRQRNVACKAIDNVSKDLVMCDWTVHAPQTLIEASGQVEEGILTAPRDIKTQLSKLLLNIVTKHGQQEI